MTRFTVLRAALAIGLVGGLHALDFVTAYSPHLWQLYGLVADGIRSVLGSAAHEPIAAAVVNASVMSLHAGLVLVAYWLLGRVPLLRPQPECACRECGHALRGLREPRCPECGASI